MTVPCANRRPPVRQRCPDPVELIVLVLVLVVAVLLVVLVLVLVLPALVFVQVVVPVRVAAMLVVMLVPVVVVVLVPAHSRPLCRSGIRGYRGQHLAVIHPPGKEFGPLPAP